MVTGLLYVNATAGSSGLSFRQGRHSGFGKTPHMAKQQGNDMDTDDLRNLGSVETAKASIRDLRVKIDERMAQLHDRIGRIRQNAKDDEREAVERAYAEIEPLRRQMEAIIQSVASIEALTMPPPTIRLLDEVEPKRRPGEDIIEATRKLVSR
jgi:hypothetical protein